MTQFTKSLKPLHVTHPQCRPPRASRPCRRGKGRYRPRARKHSPASPPSSGPSRPPMGSERVVTRPLIGHNHNSSSSTLEWHAFKVDHGICSLDELWARTPYLLWQRDSFPPRALSTWRTAWGRTAPARCCRERGRGPGLSGCWGWPGPSRTATSESEKWTRVDFLLLFAKVWFFWLCQELKESQCEQSFSRALILHHSESRSGLSWVSFSSFS